MENFVLYEQVGQGDHFTIFKGRRKDTINFLAIHCAEKCKRPEITNMVRMLHDIKHDNIVKFYEWYETSNHLWLILELCTGGSLEKLLSEDLHLPEPYVRRFAIDLVRGLHHLHSIGIVFGDIKPSKILFNGPGTLKFADFGLSRIEGENLEQILELYMEGGEGFGTAEPENNQEELKDDIPKKLRTQGTLNYMAPEVLSGQEPSMSSDLWSLGCVFYEMFAGHPPFLMERSEVVDFQQLRKRILSKDFNFTSPRVIGSRVNSGRPSAEFQNLFDCLLEKDAKKRINWTELLVHPFWQGELKNLITDNSVVTSNIRQSVRQSIANFSEHISTATGGNTVADSKVGTIQRSLQDASETDSAHVKLAEDIESPSKNHQPGSQLTEREPQVLFTLSARPRTAAMEDDPDAVDHLTGTSAQKMLHEASARKQPDKYEDRNDVSSLIFHISDFHVTPIIDMVKQSQKINFKYDPKALSITTYQAEKLMSMSGQDRERHFTAIMESLTSTEKGPPSQRQIQLLHYVALISAVGQIANGLVRHGVLSHLCKQVKEAQQVELKSKYCLIIRTVASNVTELDSSVNINEAMSILNDLVREGFRVAKVKLAVLPALGELLYLVASQEEGKCSPRESWSVPSVTYNLVMRCLNENEEPAVQQLATKIIENVASKAGQHSLKFVTNDVALQLWHVSSHATGDSLRATALSALCRLSRFSASIIQNIVEKVGLEKLLALLSIPVAKIQQAVVTMLAALITSDVSKQMRIIQDKEFMLHTMRLLESPSVVVRAKAFLVILVIISGNSEYLLAVCQNRLVMYVERDRRKQAVGKVDNAEQAEYLNHCLDLLITEMVDAVPRISRELLLVLENILGRKHPSSAHIKQLKSSFPVLAVVQHLVISSTFRTKILSEGFMKNMAAFLSHVLSAEVGATPVKSAAGSVITEEFIHTVFAIVETVVQNPVNVTDYSTIVINHLLPSLAILVSNCSGETRALSLRLFSEIAAIFLNQDSSDSEQLQLQTNKLHQLVVDTLLPQIEQILLDQDPLPSHGLKLLLALVEQHPAIIRDIEQHNLIPVLFQVLVDHQSNPVGFTMQQLAGLFNSMVTRRETNMKNLYDLGFVDHFSYLFAEVSTMGLASEETSGNAKAIIVMLLSLLETLNGTLKYVSEIVRRALDQSKKGGVDNIAVERAQAEALLHVNKPFTEFVSPLTQLLVHEDSDVADVSFRCLGLLLQLFGGEHRNSMSPRNMECYSEALKTADLKKQKTLLRLIKRLIGTDRHHLEMMRQHGLKLAEMIKSIEQAASAKAEVALSSLATEILRATGYQN